eukprot:4937867-Ditylum_brightwellii.AAC.1
MISVICTLDANNGITGGAGRIGVTKLAPASVRYAAGVIVSPSKPSALPYTPHRIPVAFWFSSLCTDLIASNVGSSLFLGIEGWVNIAVMFSISVLAILATW